MNTNIKINLFNHALSVYDYNEVNINDVFIFIKNGSTPERNFKPLINDIRNEPDKSKRNTLKLKLPAICMHGLLKPNTSRNDTNIKRFTGLVQLDIDVEYTPEQYNKLKNDKHILTLFKSPSNGLKGMILTDTVNNANEFKNLFFQVQNYYSELLNIKTDTGINDISRIMFLSYDNDIFINPVPVPFKFDKTKIFDIVNEITSKKQQGLSNYNKDKYTNKPYPVKATKNVNDLQKFFKNTLMKTDTGRHYVIRDFSIILGRYIPEKISYEQAEKFIKDILKTKGFTGSDLDNRLKTGISGLNIGMLVPFEFDFNIKDIDYDKYEYFIKYPDKFIDISELSEDHKENLTSLKILTYYGTEIKTSDKQISEYFTQNNIKHIYNE